MTRLQKVLLWIPAALFAVLMAAAVDDVYGQGYARAWMTDPGANGMLARTALNTTIARTITAGLGGVCVNGDGVSGNPTCGPDSAVIGFFSSGTGALPATCALGDEYLKTDDLRSCKCTTANVWTCNGKARAHATDCTALTGGKIDELCFERDANTIYACEPSAGDCDTPGEWTLVGGGSGAPTTAKYVVAELDAGLSAEIAPGVDDQLPVSDSATGVTWRTLLNGPVKYATSSNTFSQGSGVVSHATDCTALTNGITDDLCVELDSERLFSCQPTAAGCDTPGEWILTGDGAGGALDINGLTDEPLINPFDDRVPFYDSSAAANRKYAVREFSNQVGRNYWQLDADFLGTVGQWMVASNSGTGAACSPLAPEAGRLGLYTCTTGTTAAGRAAFTVSSFVNNSVHAILLGGGRVRHTTWLRIPTLSDGAETFSTCVGLSSTQTCNGADSVEFRYTDAVNSGKWRGVCTEDTVSTNVDDTGTAVTANVWYRLTFEVNADATSVEFLVDGTSIGTCASNIPDSGDPISPMLSILKSVGTTARTTHFDAIKIVGELVTVR